jgi:RNA polymerase sigma-70 factor (ECF subfamily)
MPESPPNLEELAARAKSGQPADFQVLAEQVREPLRRFLRSRAASAADADDLVQETLLRAFQNIDRYDPARPFQTWLFTIGKRLAINHAEARRRREKLASGSTQTEEPRTADDASAALEADQLWQKAREVLTAEQYHGLWLRYAQSYSVKETARALSRSAVSTKVLLHRARKRLLLELS